MSARWSAAARPPPGLARRVLLVRLAVMVLPPSPASAVQQLYPAKRTVTPRQMALVTPGSRGVGPSVLIGTSRARVDRCFGPDLTAFCPKAGRDGVVACAGRRIAPTSGEWLLRGGGGMRVAIYGAGGGGG